MDTTQREAITAAIVAAMRSFEEAGRARNVDEFIGYFADIPEFHVYSDGKRQSYDEGTSGIRKTFSTLRSIEGGFVDLNVIVLAPDAALMSGTFRESVTDTSGQTTRVRGAATWLWREINGRWLMVYGQADHYPDIEP